LTGAGDKRKLKKFAEEVSKGLIDKVREKGKALDPNFWVDDDGSGTTETFTILTFTNF
jgi:hypothetical protein